MIKPSRGIPFDLFQTRLFAPQFPLAKRCICDHIAVGGDGHLAQVKVCILDTPAQCVCYNPDGTMLAVGLGGGLVSDSGEWSTQGEIQARGSSVLGVPKEQ